MAMPQVDKQMKVLDEPNTAVCSKIGAVICFTKSSVAVSTMLTEFIISVFVLMVL